MARGKKCFCQANLRPDGTCSDPFCSPAFRAPRQRLRTELAEQREKERRARFNDEHGFPKIDHVREKLKEKYPNFAAECALQGSAARQQRRARRAAVSS